jgi:hypothetical protein
MKQILTLSFLLIGLNVFSQQQKESSPEVKGAETSTDKENAPARTAGTSSQSRVTEPVKLQYDVNDKYMGRSAEFLGNLTVSELPKDFPLYEKQWSLKEYNEVVLAFYYNHQEILRESVMEKIKMQKH